MLRLSSYLAVACVSLLVSAGYAIAEDEKWTVSETMGAASVVSPMTASHKLAKGEALAPGATLTTGADGKVVFGDGKSVVTVGANSRLTMPADPSDTMTRFSEDLGSVFFKVEKRPMQHFEVQTPLIAAVVKGTQFTVTAGALEHAVEVTEGLVEVVAMTGGQKQLVPAGRSARVLAGAPAKLKVAGDRATSTLASTGTSITRSIGAEPINYAMVTDGLVAATPTVTGLTTTKNSGGSNATGNGISATTDGSVVAVDLGAGAAGGVVADVVVGAGNAGGGGGVTAGLDAGAGTGGGSGVGVVGDVGAGTGGSSGTGVTVGAGSGSSGIGIGVGVTGGTPPGHSGGSGGIGVGVGGTPPGHSKPPGG